MTLRIRKRLSRVKHKTTGRLGRVVYSDRKPHRTTESIFVLWDDQEPVEGNLDGPTQLIAILPYSKTCLERFAE